MAFAKHEFADDMVHFWMAIEQTRSIEDAKAFRKAAMAIFITYIKSRRIKIITAMQRKKIRKKITTPGKQLPHSIYDDVQGLVFDVIYGRVYAHYLTDQAEAASPASPPISRENNESNGNLSSLPPE